MSYPDFQPLDELTIDELNKKHSELMSRWRAARSMSMDQNVLHQLDLMIQSVEMEKDKRNTTVEQPNGVVIDTDPIPPIPVYSPKDK